MDPDLLGVFAMLAFAGAGMWWLMSQPEPPRRLRLLTADPWFERARAEARRTVPTFRALLVDHPGAGMVKQRLNWSDGIYRGRWADVVDVSDEGVVGRLRGPNTSIELAWNEIEDWQIRLPDGRFAGAFTVMAGWKIRERFHGEMPIEGAREVARFREWDAFSAASDAAPQPGADGS